MKKEKARGLASLALGSGCTVYYFIENWMALVIGIISFSLIFMLGE